MLDSKSRRVSVDLGEALDQAVSEAAEELGLSKPETLRRAASYLREALADSKKGYCVGAWRELDEGGIDRRAYVIR